MKRKQKNYKCLMTLGLSTILLLSGCSNKSEEEVYGMKVAKLEEQSKKAAKVKVTDKQKRVLSAEESKKLEVGTFSDNMPNEKALEKVEKDFICILYTKYPDGTESINLEYRNTYSDDIPYARDFYLTDGINGEFWCVGYIICEMKYEEKDGKTYKMVQIPEEFGSTKMYWHDAGPVNGKVSMLSYTDNNQ